MPSYSAPKRRQPPRVLLVLVGVFVVIAVVVVATHKNSTTPAATPPATNAKMTTTAAGGKTSATPARRTPSTAAGLKAPLAGGKTTTTTSMGDEPITLGPGPHVLFDIHGNGDDTIGRFVIDQVATSWDVKWSYNCSKLRKKGGFNYTIVATQGTRPDPSDPGPRQTGSIGSGVERYHNPGTFGMTVATQCSWNIEISESNA
jgi:hypothetical protein